eukprot:m.413819 g.413819  ORF g.413819 m.413819 type:complete len:60 (+) comp16823_c0_seq27:3912-4091(+)
MPLKAGTRFLDFDWESEIRSRSKKKNFRNKIIADWTDGRGLNFESVFDRGESYFVSILT